MKNSKWNSGPVSHLRPAHSSSVMPASPEQLGLWLTLSESLRSPLQTRSRTSNAQTSNPLAFVAFSCSVYLTEGCTFSLRMLPCLRSSILLLSEKCSSALQTKSPQAWGENREPTSKAGPKQPSVKEAGPEQEGPKHPSPGLLSLLTWRHQVRGLCLKPNSGSPVVLSVP